MADYWEAKVHDYWLDNEFLAYYTILETVSGELRLIITPKQEEKK